MRSTFATYHPLINFGFFCAVIGIGMFLIHPVFLMIGTIASMTYALMLGGKGIMKFLMTFLLPTTVVVAVENPLVNHQGSTILFYTEYSYITLEAVVYGIMMAV